MSQYPENADVFVDKTGADNIASSDPNNSFAAIEAVEGLVGVLGKPQSWSTTLMTLLRQYKSGMQVKIVSGTLSVTAGEAVLENTDGTKWVFRRNTADVELSTDNLDVGTIAATQYTIYLKGPSAATTAGVVFSTDALAPSGIGTAPYAKIGWFTNAIAAALTPTYGGGYYEGGSASNSALLYDTTINNVSASSYGTLPGSELTFISNGGPVKIDATLTGTIPSSITYVSISIDGVVKPESENKFDAGAANSILLPVVYLETLTAGPHLIQLQAKVSGGNYYVTEKKIIVQEL